MDKLHIGAEIKDIEAECQELTRANDIEQTNLEQMFNERTQTQQQIHHFEEEIKKERYATEKMMENMSPEMRDKYAKLSDENIKLQKAIDQIQHELDDIMKEKALFEQQISSSSLKQETIELELKLLELEEKRRNLITEENENDPSNLHKNYLNQVKEDNIEIATMERSMNQLQDELKNYEKQLEQVEQDLEECQSERHKKYLELRKREETIESFLSTYEQTRDEENENREKLKSEIVRTMIAISQHLLTLPATENEYELINQDEPQIDDEEMKGQHSLYMRYKQKQLYLEKLLALETKLRNEEDSLRQRIENTETEIEKFRNLDGLKADCEKKRLDLQEKKDRYLETRDTVENELKSAKKEYEKIEKELQQNETHKQLKALERKLALIEEENSAIREFIADKKNETNYIPCKQLVLDLLKKYNEDLKEKYKHTLQEAVI